MNPEEKIARALKRKADLEKKALKRAAGRHKTAKKAKDSENQYNKLETAWQNFKKRFSSEE